MSGIMNGSVNGNGQRKTPQGKGHVSMMNRADRVRCQLG